MELTAVIAFAFNVKTCRGYNNTLNCCWTILFPRGPGIGSHWVSISLVVISGYVYFWVFYVVFHGSIQMYRFSFSSVISKSFNLAFIQTVTILFKFEQKITLDHIGLHYTAIFSMNYSIRFF